jgi:hypothetical protein
MKVQEIKNLINQDQFSTLEGPFYSKKDVLEILDKIEETSFDVEEFRKKFIDTLLEEVNIEQHFDDNIIEGVDLTMGYDNKVEVENYNFDYTTIIDIVVEILSETFEKIK